MRGNPYQQYKNTQIQTASQERLLIMLYEGAIKFTNQGKLAFEEEKYDNANELIKRAQDIVNELMISLDFNSGEVAGNLFALYEYIYHQLVQANIKKDTSILDEVTGLLTSLKETWVQALTSTKMQSKGEMGV
ncbi:MAG TPA: flagellar export chaperone FliS [Thermoanaerobacterales bacterium]|nr:flagellar export chaperone FliS [Thermoanaerobacterales bacterium]